jgi:hypothetical protein
MEALANTRKVPYIVRTYIVPFLQRRPHGPLI